MNRFRRILVRWEKRADTYVALASRFRADHLASLRSILLTSSAKLATHPKRAHPKNTLGELGALGGLAVFLRIGAESGSQLREPARHAMSPPG